MLPNQRIFLQMCRHRWQRQCRGVPPPQPGLAPVLNKGRERLFSHKVKGRLLLGKKSDFHSKKPKDKESVWQVSEAASPTADFICTAILKNSRLCYITAGKVVQLFLLLSYRDHLAAIGNVRVGGNILLKAGGWLAVFTSPLAQWHHQMPGRYASIGKSLRRPAPTRSQTLCKQNHLY